MDGPQLVDAFSCGWTFIYFQFGSLQIKLPCTCEDVVLFRHLLSFSLGENLGVNWLGHTDVCDCLSSRHIVFWNPTISQDHQQGTRVLVGPHPGQHPVS